MSLFLGSNPASVYVGSTLASKVYLGTEQIWPTGPNYSPLYSTDWEEYSLGTIIGTQSGWARGNTTSGRQIEVFDQSGNKMVRADRTSGNNNVWRTVETPSRSSVYARAVFPFIQKDTRALCGVSFHHGSSDRRIAVIRWDGSNYIPTIGTLTGVFGNRSYDINGSAISEPVEWTIEIRATGTNAASMYVNGNQVLSIGDTSSISGQLSGLVMDEADTSRCSSFQLGTIS